MSTSNNTQQVKKASIGQAFSILLGTITALILFVPRLINAADKGMNMVDDLLDSGNILTNTMKQSAEDFKTLSALEGQVNYAERLEDINQTRRDNGLAPVDITSSRNSDAVAEALAALGK